MTHENKTTEVVSLAEVREARSGPDADFIRQDEYGRKLFLYTARYQFPSKVFVGEAGTYSINFWAYSVDEAKAMIEGMKQSLEYEGQIYAQM